MFKFVLVEVLLSLQELYYFFVLAIKKTDESILDMVWGMNFQWHSLKTLAVLLKLWTCCWPLGQFLAFQVVSGKRLGLNSTTEPRVKDTFTELVCVPRQRLTNMDASRYSVVTLIALLIEAFFSPVWLNSNGLRFDFSPRTRQENPNNTHKHTHTHQQVIWGKGSMQGRGSGSPPWSNTGSQQDRQRDDHMINVNQIWTWGERQRLTDGGFMGQICFRNIQNHLKYEYGSCVVLSTV